MKPFNINDEIAAQARKILGTCLASWWHNPRSMLTHVMAKSPLSRGEQPPKILRCGKHSNNL